MECHFVNMTWGGDVPFREGSSHSRTLSTQSCQGAGSRNVPVKGKSLEVSPDWGFFPDGLRHPGEAAWVTSGEIHCEAELRLAMSNSSTALCPLPSPALISTLTPSILFPSSFLSTTSHFFSTHPLLSSSSSLSFLFFPSLRLQQAKMQQVLQEDNLDSVMKNTASNSELTKI